MAVPMCANKGKPDNEPWRVNVGFGIRLEQGLPPGSIIMVDDTGKRAADLVVESACGRQMDFLGMVDDLDRERRLLRLTFRESAV